MALVESFGENENHGSTTARQSELNSHRTERLKIMETSTGYLKIRGQSRACAEGNRDCDLGIYSFCFHRNLKRNRR